MALLLDFEKAGFTVPIFEALYAEQVAAGLEAYFSALVPLLKRGHYNEARAVASNTAQSAVEVAKKLRPESEWFYPNL